ncbi:lysophospholipid acyltransferase family protein [Metamycoplasma buccale]|uniref:lysophospholipid acyltransferase family protein n=1 Tax=Metamycoplasma buccale TaxID=55602 RepID=UPI00398EAEBD
MKLRTRIFWNLFPILINFWTLQIKARRNNKMPDYYSKYEKNRIVQKKFENILKYLGIELEVKGFENVPNNPCILIPNHSTYLDPLIMMVALSNLGDGEKQSKLVNFVARSEVKDKKSIALVASFFDTHYLDFEKPRELIKTLFNFGNFVKTNKSCGVIFAEGTRTKDGMLGEFKTGAFRLAQSCYLPIIPVTINNAANALDKNRNGKLKIEVIFHNQIKPINFQTLSSEDLATQVKNVISSHYHNQIITSNETKTNKFTKRAHK